MINFKNREELAPSLLALASVLTLLGTLLYMVMVPPPSAAGLAKGRNLSRIKIEEEIETAKKRAAELEQTNLQRLWTGSPEAVTAAVLDTLTKQAATRSLKLTAFRPQRTQPLNGLTELPFSVQVSGPYTKVREVLSSLDAPGSRLALRSVQIASADAASSSVTATLAISAYLPGPAAAPATATGARTTTGGGSRG